MKILFNRHAKRQMKWRRITRKEVLRVIESPEKEEPSIKGRINRFAHVDNRLLVITFAIEKGNIIIITAIDKSRGRHENRV